MNSTLFRLVTRGMCYFILQGFGVNEYNFNVIGNYFSNARLHLIRIRFALLIMTAFVTSRQIQTPRGIYLRHGLRRICKLLPMNHSIVVATRTRARIKINGNGERSSGNATMAEIN